MEEPTSAFVSTWPKHSFLVAILLLWTVAALYRLLLWIVAAFSRDVPRNTQNIAMQVKYPPFDTVYRRFQNYYCYRKRNLRIKSVDVFKKLRDLPSLECLRGTQLGSYSYMVCDPKDKDENLCKALLHTMYNRLCNEAMSKNPLNPHGSFDLLAECPKLCESHELIVFHDIFKTIKNHAVEVLRQVHRIEHLSDPQRVLLVELIKVIIIKKVYENLENVQASIDVPQLNWLISQMILNDFVPSTKDTLKLVSNSLSISIHVLKPGNKVSNSNAYGNYSFDNYETTSTSVQEMVLLDQNKDNSYVLATPPKELYEA